MAMMSYVVVLEAESDGGFSISVPDLPGCASHGESQLEALANVREAIELHIEGLKADGLAVPTPRAQIATIEVKVT
jgi:predicted RNase H-like HicB family nuclease